MHKPMTNVIRKLADEADQLRRRCAFSEDFHARVSKALRLALNFIENTESELGIKLGSGDALRAALSPSGMPIESNINKCPSCSRMFVDGETCPRGGCPMGGDV